MDKTGLIKQAQAGHQQAFRLLVLRYQGPLFKFLNGYALTSTSVEDIAQETFLRAYRNIHKYDSTKGASFTTWLFTIAKRLAFDEMTRGRRYTPLSEAQESLVETESVCSGYESVSATQQRQQLHQALRQLSEPFHSAVVLSYIKELSLKDVAAIEQCSIGTIKSRIFRGKKQLRALLAHTAR